MMLSDEQVQQVLAHFEEKVGHYVCPLCEGESASLGVTMYVVPEFKPMNGISSDSGMPLVALSCDNCGHVLFFSAETLGVI